MNARRRILLALIALAASPSARAQAPGRLPRVALVDTVEPAKNMVEGQPLWGWTLGELRRLGYEEGKNVVIERWSAEGAASEESYRNLARKVVGQRPTVIVVRSRPLLIHVAAETRDIPIVALASITPELRKAGGNITGIHVSFDAQQLYGKQVEMLASILKRPARIAWLGPATIWNGAAGEAARIGAQTAKVTLAPILIASPVSKRTIRAAFGEIARAKFDALLISPASELYRFRESITELAASRRLPSLGNSSLWAEAGALLGYGANSERTFRRAADFTQRILKGAPVSALPIENPTQVDLTINLETAKSLKLALPQSLLQRADRVIE